MALRIKGIFQLSMATRQFLQGNNIVECGIPDEEGQKQQSSREDDPNDNDMLNNIAQLLKQPKLKD